MIEWVIPAALGASAFLPIGRKSDKKKIEVVFQRLELYVKDDHKLFAPTYFGKQDHEHYMEYIYRLPLGLASEEIKQQTEVFEEALKKPVQIVYDGYLRVYVFKKPLPTMFKYEDVPAPEKWCVPIGKTYRDVLYHDFDKTPHMTIAGTTRFGKTVMLKTILTSLIENQPDDVEIYIIDLKGGLEFERYRRLKQVKGVATNQIEAAMLLQQIMENGRDREAIFRRNLWSNIVETPLTTRTFIIVDEAAQLTPDPSLPNDVKKLLESCQHALSEVCRVFGALGFRNIFATQYPTSECMPRQIKMNSDGKISFRLPAGYASKVAIDETGAEKLPSDIKGRGLYKTHELTMFQAPYISDKEMMNRLGRWIQELYPVIE